MDPDLFKVFAQEFAAEWNRLQADAGGESHSPAQRERARLPAIDRLVDALVDGEPAARLKENLKELEQRRLQLEGELQTTAAPAAQLHPNIAEVYRRKVEELNSGLKCRGPRPVRDFIRGLVEAKVLIPESGGLTVEVRANWRQSCGGLGWRTKKPPLSSRKLFSRRKECGRGRQSLSE